MFANELESDTTGDDQSDGELRVARILRGKPVTEQTADPILVKSRSSNKAPEMSRKMKHSRVSDLRSLQVEGLCVLTEQHHVLLQVPHVPVFMVPHTFLSKDKNKTAALSDAYIHTGRTTLNFTVCPSFQIHQDTKLHGR